MPDVWRMKLSPQAFLERSARVFGDKEAVVYGSQRYNYAEMYRRVNRFASALQRAGIARSRDPYRPGANLTEEDIIEFARTRMAPYKRPKAVEFGDLPKTSTGKVQKHLLREREWGGLDKRIH